MQAKTKTKYIYDVIVVGAGHAGIEAAAASAKTGSKTLIITTNLDTIGHIACSATFGGPGRGQLLKEIDVFGCLMPTIIDQSAVHYRHSGNNKSSWAPFAVCDKDVYQKLIKFKLESITGLEIKQDKIEKIYYKNGKWCVESYTDQIYSSRSVVIAGGTFLNGRLHKDKETQKAGRNNEISSDELCASLKKLGLKLTAFRTGTGPSVQLVDISGSNLEKQLSDKRPRMFSSASIVKKDRVFTSTYKAFLNISDCDVLHKKRNTKTTKGPRHCPSLYEKLINHPDKETFSVFLQPETIDANTWFLNGLSMDFSEEEQLSVIRSIEGLRNASVLRYGYSVTYSCLKSGQLKSNLESKTHKGLFFAGQATGSSGYEEAAASGFVAGLNASLYSAKKDPVIFDRKDGFLSVLVDDITSKKILEPYRIMLSRAHNFIDLRSDNADIRYAEMALNLGLGSAKRLAGAKTKAKIINKMIQGSTVASDDAEILREVEALKKIDKYLANSPGIKFENIVIPNDINYSETGISKEAIEKLEKYQPASIDEARLYDVPEKSLKALSFYLQRTSKQ